MKEEAVKQYILKIKEKEYPPLVEAALISNANKTIKEYIRKSKITQFAIENLATCDNLSEVKISLETKEVDEEWMSRFFDSAKHISNEDIQLIWGHILANELVMIFNLCKLIFSLCVYLEITGKSVLVFT